MTLADLCRWWLDHKCPEASRVLARGRLERHVCAKPLGAALLPSVTTEALEALLSDTKRPDRKPQAPATVNRLRTVQPRSSSRASWPLKAFEPTAYRNE